MLSFSVCPHDIKKGELQGWQQMAQVLSEAIGEPISFEVLSSFSEERERLKADNFFDIYYANPFSAVELYKRGYYPIAKFKGQRDRYFLFHKEIPQKGKIKVATAILRPVGLVLLQLDIERVEVELCESWQEVLEAVESGRAHAGIMYEEVWQTIGQSKKGNFKTLDRLVFESSHIFMVKPEVKDRLKEFFLKEDFEPGEQTLRELLRAYEDFENLYRLWSKVKAFGLMEEMRGVGLILYWGEGITLINNYALRVLEYDKEELISMSLEEAIKVIIHPSQRDKVYEVAQKRLKGEHFTQSYAELVYISKRGRYIHTYTYSATVPYGDKVYGGLVLFIDITERKRLEALYEVLRNINLAITTALFEEELFDVVSKSLADKLGFSVCIVLRERGKNPQVYKSYNLPAELEEEILGNLVNSNGIYIEPDIRTYERYKLLTAEGVASFCSIPLRSPDDRFFFLNLYSREPYFFEDKNKEILYEIKHDLEFALQKIYDFRKAFIIKNALDRSSSWLVVTDQMGIINYVNDAVCRITGYSREELIGEKTNIFKSGFHDQSFYEELWKTIKSGKEFNAIFINRKKNGETFYLEQHIYPVKLPGGIIRYVSIGRDITREIELSEEVRRLSLIDPMTGLLNKTGFESLIEEHIKDSSESIFAFVVLDLYGTGSINYKLGLSAGDKYVQSFGDLLRKEFKDTKFVGRLYGDKFGILVPLRSEKDIFLLEERLTRLMENYVDVGQLVPVSFNAGISLYPKDGRTFSELYSRAKVALKRSKELGEGKIVISDAHMQEKLQDFMFAMKLVKTALEEELFVLYFQPYFELETLEPKGFEALIRIVDKEGRVYSPAYFIDYLERSKYLSSFEGWLVREAIKSADTLGFAVSINLSANTLRSGEFLKALLSIPHIPLVIEITERTIVELEEDTLQLLEILRKEKGVKIAMDDFGTGYSTLSQLSQLPVDILKIDMSFVKNMLDNRRIRAIVRNTLALARDLGIITLAEGIETEPQLRMLQGMGCDLVQGFLFAKPMPLEEALLFLEKYKVAGAVR